MELIGWIGSLLFAFCALPQCILVYKQKHARGLSWYFLSMWAVGEVFCFVYVLDQSAKQWPLLFNYAINFVMLMVIFYYKIVNKDVESVKT